MSDLNCKSCNAPNPGLICEYCGAQNGKITSPTDELAAVEGLKHAFANIGNRKTNVLTSAIGGALSKFGLDPKTTEMKNLIDSMWVPSSPDAALRLGMFLLSYVITKQMGVSQSQREISQSAMLKLEALVAQLDLEHPNSSSTQKLQTALNTKQKQIRANVMKLWAMILSPIVLLILLFILKH